MVHQFLCVCGIVIGLMATGCCGPIGCGVGCNTGGCYDCDGTYDPGIVMTPMDGLRNIKRNLVCGGGCGDVYYGEWRSTPPYASDPCCGDEFVGGGTRCQPFCWQWRPGMLLSSFYGQRFCDSGCNDGCDIGCDDCGGGYIDGGTTSGGCATCNAQSSEGSARMATQPQSRPMSNPQTRNMQRSPQHTAQMRTSGRGQYIRR